MTFSEFETSVLAKFAELYGRQVAGLLDQLAAAKFVRRENTRNGFFTNLVVDRAAFAPLTCPSPLDGPTVRFGGMIEGIDIILFLKDGYVDLLEGYAVAGEDTSSIDFDDLAALPMTLRYPIRTDLQ